MTAATPAPKEQKIRVSELARELRCKANDIIAVLEEPSRKVTHSSRITQADVDKVKEQFAKNPPKKQDSKPHRKWVADPTGALGLAKSIAARFGEEICEEEFFDEPTKG